MFQFFHFLESVDSTNEYLKQFLSRRQPGAAMAAEQTGGKGRHGRCWYSPRGEGLYVSFLLYPDWPLAKAEWLNRIATVAVVRSLAGLPSAERLKLEIKQPNDVLVSGKKLSGALVELASLGDRVQWAIVGIGVNLSQTSFQLSENRTEPTSLRLEGVPAPAARQLCAILAEQFSDLYRDLEAGGEEPLLREFETLQKAPNPPQTRLSEGMSRDRDGNQDA